MNTVSEAPRRRRRNPVALVVVLLLALGGGGAGVFLASRPEQRKGVSLGQDFFVSTPAPLPLTRGEGTVSEGPAPDFVIRTLDGETVSLADIRGRPTVIFFMAYWCGSCIPEAEALGRLHERFASRGLRIFAVDIDPTSSPEALREFIDAAGNPGYVFALDDGGKTARAFKVFSLDTTVVIDRDGRIVYRDAYVSDYDTLLRPISKVIG